MLERTCGTIVITAPAGAVAKYCDEYVCFMCVCVCVCVSVCPRVYRRNHTRDLYQFFVHVAYDRGSVLLRQSGNISRGSGNFRRFFLTDNALYSKALGTHTKTADPIDMPFGMMSGLGPRNSVLRGSDEGEGGFLGKHVPDKPTTL